MDGVPVANHGEDEQQKRDQEQAGGFRGIDRVVTTLAGGAALTLALMNLNHNFIVRRDETPRVAWCYTTRRWS